MADARAEALALMKSLVVERAVQTYSTDYKNATGKKISANALAVFRATVESDPAQERLAREILDSATGFGQRQGLLDSFVILLWGVAGSLAAALFWEHRKWAPEICVAAAFLAVMLQFRTHFARWRRWRLVAFCLFLAGAVVLVSARDPVRDFISTHTSRR